MTLALAACAQPRAGDAEPGPDPPPSAHVTVPVVGVDVLPMDRDALLRDRTVIVRDGRIAQIAPTATVDLAPGTFRIDGTGKVLMPGLAEMHGHVQGPDDPLYAQDV